MEDFVFISVPKCGTNLLVHILEELSGLKNFVPEHHNKKRNIDYEDLKRNSQFVVSHELFEEECDYVIKNKYKVISIYRDPRDQLISLIFYTKTITEDSSEERINNVITSCIDRDIYEKWYSDVFNQFKKISSENLLRIKFEDLIGSRGMGDDEIQLQTVIKLSEFLDIQISHEKAKLIVDKVWGHSITFRKGCIGDWKLYFKLDHILMYKQKYGKELIELGYEKDYSW